MTYYAESSNTATSCSSLTRTAVTLEILAAPSAPVSGGDQSECEVTTLLASATSAGNTITWYDAATGGNIVAVPSLDSVGSVTYYAESSNTATSCSSLTRTAVTLEILAAPSAPVSGGDQSECEVTTLLASATSAGNTITWYDAATGGNIVAVPSLDSVGSVTYYAESSNTATSCSSLTRTAVTLEILAAPSAPVSGGDQSECEVTTLLASATSAGNTITWYDAATGGNIVAVPSLDSVGSVTYYAESSNTATSCSSLTRTAVTLEILAAPSAPVSGGDQSECEVTTLLASATSAGNTITWYDAATGGNDSCSPKLR